MLFSLGVDPSTPKLVRLVTLLEEDATFEALAVRLIPNDPSLPRCRGNNSLAVGTVFGAESSAGKGVSVDGGDNVDALRLGYSLGLMRPVDLSSVGSESRDRLRGRWVPSSGAGTGAGTGVLGPVTAFKGEPTTGAPAPPRAFARLDAIERLPALRVRLKPERRGMGTEMSGGR